MYFIIVNCFYFIDIFNDNFQNKFKLANMISLPLLFSLGISYPYILFQDYLRKVMYQKYLTQTLPWQFLRAL